MDKLRKLQHSIDELSSDEQLANRSYEFARVYMNKPYHERIFTKLEATLIQVSGFDVEKLIELFAAGYTLEPPKKAGSMANILKGEYE